MLLTKNYHFHSGRNTSSYCVQLSANAYSSGDSESKQRSFNMEAQLQDTTVLICSYVITLAYNAPGGDL